MSLLSTPSTRVGVNALLDQLRQVYELSNDSQLARTLSLSPAIISKLRAGSPLTPAIVVRIHEFTNMPLATVVELAARRSSPDHPAA